MKLQIMAVVVHPESGRMIRFVDPRTNVIRLEDVFIPIYGHPLGGWIGNVNLHRRVNLRKDYVPRWHRDGGRPLYEFVQKENQS